MPEISFDQLILTETEKKAIRETEHLLKEQFPVEQVILFGSVARGEADEESDTDLLILTTKPMSRRERRQITDTLFEINLKYGTNFSGLVMDSEAWETGIISLLPIKEEILHDGVII